MSVKIFAIEEYKTSEGSMFPIYRDWDTDTHDGHVPKMVYVTTMKPGTSKGPIYHAERTAFITATSGDVTLEYSNNGVDVSKCSLRSRNKSHAVIVSPGTAIKLVNSSADETATVINLPNPAWHPDNQDTVKFDSWSQFETWKSSK